MRDVLEVMTRDGSRVVMTDVKKHVTKDVITDVTRTG